jgi:carbonic anhydrase/acetyltransferase-like protein (isoleucine patch superfamily)
MKAYILPSGTTISPFQDPVCESMIGNRTLAEIQERVLRRAGMEVYRISGPEAIEDDTFLLTYDDVFFTRRTMDDMVKRFKREGHSMRFGLPADSLFVKRTAALQELQTGEGDGQELALYNIYFIKAHKAPGNAAELQACLNDARPVCARFKEKIVKMPAPANIYGFSDFEHPVTSSVIIHISHWLHILWANQYSIQINWVNAVLDHKLWAIWKLVSSGVISLFAGRWSRSGYLATMLRRANRKGKNCQIHPTALVEGCQMGDNVKIGAYAIVRGCLLGDNVTIEEKAGLFFTVVGSNCFISKNSTMVFCAGYPDSDLCINGIQYSLFGRKCGMTSHVWVLDIQPVGEVQVLHKGKLCPIGTNFLGACFGHGSFAGANVFIGSGREIPNGAMLVRPPGEILRKIPPDLPPGVLAWAENGVAVPSKKKPE